MRYLANFITGGAIRLLVGGSIPSAIAIGLLCVVLQSWWDVARGRLHD